MNNTNNNSKNCQTIINENTGNIFKIKIIYLMKNVTTLKPYKIINLIIHGSQASRLSLSESDIDLLLII